MKYRVSITIYKKRYTLIMKAKSIANALKIISKQARKYRIENRISHIHVFEICK